MGEQLGENIIDWRIQFAEVFAGEPAESTMEGFFPQMNKTSNRQMSFTVGEQRGGFDIVLANPPYVSAQEFAKTRPKTDRATLNANYETAKGAWDLYVLFFERGTQLLRERGQLCFITPNKFLAAPYAVALRSFLTTRASVKSIVDVSRIPVFASVHVYPVLTHVIKGRQNLKIVEIIRPTEEQLNSTDGLRSAECSQISTELMGLLPDNIWSFILGGKSEVLQRLLLKTQRFQLVGEVNATTTAAEADDYGSFLADKRPPKGFKVVNTGTIDPYVSLWGTVELTHQRRRFLTPWLSESVVSARRAALYREPKLIFAKMAKSCEAFWDVDGAYAALNANCFYKPRAALRLGYVAGYVHSRFFMFLYEQFFGALRMQGGYFQFQSPQLRVMPLLIPPDGDQEFVEHLVQEILQGGDQELLQSQIDARLEQLFDVRISELAPEGGGEAKPTAIPTVEEMLIAAEAWADERKKAGWTRADFLSRLPEILNEGDEE